MSQDPTPSAPPSAGDLLIIDDTAANLTVLSLMLQKSGYQIEIADSGAQGLDLIRNHPPDLVLLDVMMPEMDGFEVCRRLKADPRTRDIPVIFLSAQTSLATTIRAFDVGGVDYIVKPFHEQEVSVRVRSQLERVRAERALRDREEGYRHLLEAVFDGLLLHRRGQILQVNSQLSHMLGYTAAEMVNHSLREFVDPPQWPMVVAIIERGGISHFEMRLVHKNGSLIDTEVLGHPFSYLGEGVRVVAVRDITERKKAEQHAFDLAVEKERVQVLSSFVTQTSHEFRTPLTNIELRASLIDRVPDPDKRRQYVQEIREQVAGMNELLNASLMMARLDSGLDLDFAPVDVNALFRLVCANLEEAAEKNGLALTIDEGEVLPPIQGNRSMLQTALTHLLENALRYTPPGGQVQIGGYQDGDQIVIEVRDTGVGLTQEQARRIFERFYRVDEAHSTRGFGLGLPIVKRIVEVHRGQIEVQSEPNQGSTFRIFLPTN